MTKLQWRGRWREVRTLAHYVQELEASAIGLRWPPAVQGHIRLLASAVEVVLEEVAIEFTGSLVDNAAPEP